MPDGKYFVLVNGYDGSTLGIENSSKDSNIITVKREDSDEKQQWYIDLVSGSIRNRFNKMSITESSDGSNLVLQDTEKGKHAQQFVLTPDNMVQNVCSKKVVNRNNRPLGKPAFVCDKSLYPMHDRQWKAAYQSPKYFVIKGNQSGKVLDIKYRNLNEGAVLILYDQNNEDHQLWYEDRDGRIRAKSNDFVFDGSSHDICMQPFAESLPKRSWVISGSCIVQSSDPRMVLSVNGEATGNGATISGDYEYRKQTNQLWDFIDV